MNEPYVLRLERFALTDRSTIGRLFAPAAGRLPAWRGYVLEDRRRPLGEKVPGETAIPAGVYPVQFSWSPRFQRELPVLWNVPGFEGIRIHPGNTPADTEGCLLPGESYGPDRVDKSRRAADAVFALLRAAIRAGREALIEILDPNPPEVRP